MNINILIALVFGGAFFIQSIFGFAGGFLSVLILSMIIPMKSALGMVPLVINVACLVSVLADLRSVRFRATLRIFLYSVPGFILAGVLLSMISGDLMALIASCLILLYSVYAFSGREFKVAGVVEPIISSLSGFIGLISGVWATYVPVMRSRIKTPEHFRTSFLFLGVCHMFVMIPVYLTNGIINRDVVVFSLWALPAVLIASWLGRRVLKKIDPEMFTKFLLLLLMLTSVIRILMLMIG